MCTDNIWIFWIFIFITFTLVFFEFSSVFYQILLHSFISNCLRLCSITFCWGFFKPISCFFLKDFPIVSIVFCTYICFPRFSMHSFHSYWCILCFFLCILLTFVFYDFSFILHVGIDVFFSLYQLRFSFRTPESL